MTDNFTIQKGILMPCCADPRNLTAQPRDPARPDVLVRVCKCGRRHIELTADPGRFGLEGASL